MWLCCEPSTQRACVCSPPLPLKHLKAPVSHLPCLQSRWLDHDGNKLRCCSSRDKVTDHMELGSFPNTQPVSFKLASQKRPRRSGQIKVVVMGWFCVLGVLFRVTFPPRTSARLLSLSEKQLFTREYFRKTISCDFS